MILEEENSKSAVLSSNLEKAIKKALSIAENLSTAWVSADYDQKQKLQYLIFPDGILYDKEKHRVLTTKTNSLFTQIPLLARVSEHKKRDDLTENHLWGSQVGMTTEISNFLIVDVKAILDY